MFMHAPSRGRLLAVDKESVPEVSPLENPHEHFEARW
jgi:hypothetical protein